MTRKINIGNVIYIGLWVIVSCMFMAANHTDIKRYSPYQLLVWSIKAEEGYRSWWYPDGRTPSGKQKYSIGYGWNDCGSMARRKKIAKYTQDGKVTRDEALQIALMQIREFGQLNSDPYKNVALQLYSYNCGRISTGDRLGKCHNGSRVHNARCGSGRTDVRISHNRRREYELALWKKNWILIQQMTESNRRKVISSSFK